MSYAIVKGIKIDTDKGQVWLKAASNNVSPRHYEWFESTSLSAILKEQGLIELEKEILEQYWNGNFQASNNIYDKAVKFYGQSIPYTWSNTGAESEVGKERYGDLILYSYTQLKAELYKKYVEYKARPKGNFFVKYNGHYVKSLTKKYIKYAASLQNAKRFNSREDAVLFSSRIHNAEVVTM